METMTLTAEPRTTSGTREAKLLRASGRVPAVIYGHNEPPESIAFVLRDVERALLHGARTLPVKMGKDTTQYLIKQVQYDHLGTTPIHLDLTRVNLDERVRVNVGVELRGTPKGVSDGGVLDQFIADIEVECLMTAIPGTLHPIVTELGLGEALLIKDLDLPEGVAALADPDDRVAAVREVATATETETEAEEEEEGGTGSAEPERIGRVRKDEEKGGS